MACGECKKKAAQKATAQADKDKLLNQTVKSDGVYWYFPDDDEAKKNNG